MQDQHSRGWVHTVSDPTYEGQHPGDKGAVMQHRTREAPAPLPENWGERKDPQEVRRPAAPRVSRFLKRHKAS